MTKPREPTARENFDAEQLLRCVRWTCVRSRGCSAYDRSAHATRAEAEATAAALGPGPFGQEPMVYGVTPEGWTIAAF